jgi:hypothetical protein
MNNSKTYLKVKLISLADEARTIRRLEYKAKKHVQYHIDKCKSGYTPEKARDMYHAYDVYNGLYLHRKKDVASEARAANIALGFMNGKSYEEIEKTFGIKMRLQKGDKLLGYYEDKLYSINGMWDRVARIVFKYSMMNVEIRKKIGLTNDEITAKLGRQFNQYADKAAIENIFRDAVFAWRDKHPLLVSVAPVREFAAT